MATERDAAYGSFGMRALTIAPFVALVAFACDSGRETPQGSGGATTTATTTTSSTSTSTSASGSVTTSTTSVGGAGGAAGAGGMNAGGAGGQLLAGAGGSGGMASGVAVGWLVSDFSVVDVNPNSATYNQAVSPKDYLKQVSGWYFGHST